MAIFSLQLAGLSLILGAINFIMRILTCVRPQDDNGPAAFLCLVHTCNIGAVAVITAGAGRLNNYVIAITMLLTDIITGGQYSDMHCSWKTSFSSIVCLK